MASARTVLEILKSSDGRIRIKTLSGVSVLVAVIALFVGVLPALAVPGPQLGADVPPQEINYGGGSGGCAFVGSAAANELHINNPIDGPFTDGNVTITLDVDQAGNLFSFTVNTPGIAVYDVTVNGGSKSNHYDYDGGPGPVGTDEDLHAPAKGNGQIFNLSHINFCYDAQQFFCDGSITTATRLNDGIFTGATAQLVSNSEHPVCIAKEGVFFIDNEKTPPSVTLEFNGSGGTAAGRLDIIKDFDNDGDNDPTDFENLQYDGVPNSTAIVEVPWCDIDPDPSGADGGEFTDVLTDGYPRLPDGHTACKVSEEENAAGIQHNVVYFEFEDPNFY